ncbi:hypothetical protein SUGI_0967590 [Cryptomeria japonica]|nr:hypothetical protein SUGI_0967590 [Cryptomeria japonica]
MYEILSEYWEESILKEIGSKLGIFISMDEILVDRSQGAYIRMCLGLPPQQVLPPKIEVNIEDGSKSVIVEREDQMLVCPNCRSKEHDNLECIGMIWVNRANEYDQTMKRKKEEHDPKDWDNYVSDTRQGLGDPSVMIVLRSWNLNQEEASKLDQANSVTNVQHWHN